MRRLMLRLLVLLFVCLPPPIAASGTDPLPQLKGTIYLAVYECRRSEATLLGITALTPEGKFEAPGEAYRRVPEVQQTAHIMRQRALENGYARENVWRTRDCPEV